MEQAENSQCSLSAREIYEGWWTSTGSTGFSRSRGDSGPSCPRKPSFGCQESYEGRQRTPDTSLVSEHTGGCDASGGRLAARRPKGKLGRLFGGCFKPWKIGSVNKVNSCANETANSGRCTDTGPHNSNQTEKRGFRFTANEVCRATRNFCSSYKIGQGSSGTVYRGRLSDGTYVAVKRGKKAMHDGKLSLEYQNEIQTLARVKHVTLVEFLGYLDNEDERIFVLEYVPNGTLREHLDGLYGTTLDLAARLDIARDVAHAVTYLHMYPGHPIVHGDIKSSSILITENFRAKVAYCGSACLAEIDTGATQILTNVTGTVGYLDPEYLTTYRLTEKSDVYSFGVLLVELVSGRRPIELKKQPKEQITVRWATRRFEVGDAVSALDSKLSRDPATVSALIKILGLALLCLAPSSKNRPTMRECANTIWNICKDYREATDVKNHEENSQGSPGSHEC
ncbi:hypothetical protein H6P81_017231 [Aristolochia fimbriata]|uniref:Protein kinase domain-containing protein n=1 Tax=Aristolochia fimbriata TaxID=158543 RepID=A0AAV7E0K9_ARIFI|nr:hypothetical protein H6P81_017231 [Aristolochia fimbriata]